ncbi:MULTISPECIES: MOSC N-terminal beta barrel domain-containing protein [unclassified Streptomyces]|uniref:MOSC domain-containing protein n=1 Tax=unclassified Streptomyces TaxID=2593676 RepID=UPI0006F8284E|nr:MULTISPECIES: MOSC N-terminal beta barrel domain-containing protein [unclassified Streptomyces]KQX49777.1 molybdenum cofactor biosysynthesis protein [Streptomyces sp. Root1304]KRA80178.1 molybdenum cofactor biosysynthesis protein [Streptomyces sp. Root66D1]
MPIPVLRSVHVHPVKAMRALAPTAAEVQPWGLADDRRWAVVDAAGGIVTQRRHPRMALATAEPVPGGGVVLSAPGHAPLTVEVPRPAATVTVEIFDDTVEAVPAGPEAAAWVSAYLEGDFRFVHMDAPEHRRPVDPEYALPGETVSFADGYPLLATTTTSLDALNSLIAQGDHADEGPLPMNRFRPNLVIEGTPPWAEDGWTRLTVGEVTFRVARPCGRCVVTTTNQLTGERGKEPLRTLARHRKNDGRVIFGQNLVPEHTGTVRVGDEVKILD